MKIRQMTFRVIDGPWSNVAPVQKCTNARNSSKKVALSAIFGAEIGAIRTGSFALHVVVGSAVGAPQP